MKLNVPVSPSFTSLLKNADHSLLRNLSADPEQSRFAPNKMPREVRSGHYVEVPPTPLPDPRYVVHSKGLFRELGLHESVATETSFMRFFTGEPTAVLEMAIGESEPLQTPPGGWACGYALSIYGQELYHNCPFRTGNGYGDGRAISVLEVLLANGKRWEFQLKGGGRTPYCRGGDGRAILRSSIREFLVSEAMAALGVPTSRALCLFVSQSETIERPWYSPESKTKDPDLMVEEPAAITTRVAPSFLRVGQLELFGRRARKNEHPQALAELEAIFIHTLEREYPEIATQFANVDATLTDKVLAVAKEFGVRLSELVAHWIRVGYCQGNFNSDNCALGGRTLDYGPFGFIEAYDPNFQMWTGGGQHFSFMNQPAAAIKNFEMFCTAVAPLLIHDINAIHALEEIADALPEVMRQALHTMWANKMGLLEFRMPLFTELHTLMAETPVDYTIFWRELSNLPEDVTALRPAFYETRGKYAQDSSALEARWSAWLNDWHGALKEEGRHSADVSAGMKSVNPKYIPREWMLVEAYRLATDHNDYSLARRLHDVFEDPYGEQNEMIEALYYKKKENKYFELGGTSHCSCSS